MRSTRPSSVSLPTAAPRSFGTGMRFIVSAGLALLLIGAQLVLSPGASQADHKPDEKQEKVYETPADLGDGAKPPTPVGTAWLVGDLDTGEIQAAHEIDKKHAPASTIKLLTALALVDVLDDPKQKVEAEFEDMEIDGTKVGLMQKNKYSVDLLFHAMLMSSANDAANALGRAAGGQEKAVALMNEKAAELGMTNTHAANTSGLDDKNQYMTVSDMMKLAWAVCEDDYLMGIIDTETFKFPGGKNPVTKKKFKGYEIQNHTKIVGEVNGGLGLKNGFTRHAKGAYIAVAERDGHRVVATLLGIDNNSRQAAVDLLEWDFAQKDPKSLQTIPIGQTITPSPAPTASESNSDAGGAASGDTASVGTDMDSREGAEASGSKASAETFGVSNEKLLPAGMLTVAAALLLTALIIMIRWRRGKSSR
ncbi:MULTISPECIES: serine hydrolase [Brevibacterium]|uniref:D-alanyl-D-alanine carboxypeptidase (Penicillin-binding protein 5/6) n=1 Tax=Brevibacterium antiquum CNRZ 918 TaxID=1255637 RepID=A0A2H1J982_9MICO|nr:MULTISPECIES: serine hydrolase [Brevibacterium]SMX83888.1 D-alanyl-D-alanine carboxypeptidase (penicillin-binding protein 5/6) [Brevibacterium antiquum CNRZ 918]HCG54654.1 D-alanyl-D-alanine carboxypeptidase [Brevibacterium sp.]